MLTHQPKTLHLPLKSETLLAMYRAMRLGRAVDERLWLLNRAGKVPFVMPHQGHEGVQAGAGMAISRRLDWVVPYYRDMTLSLVMGMTATDIMMGFFGKAGDPSCGGRQGPGHYGRAELKYVTGSSCVASQLLHAVGIGLALRNQQQPAACLTSFGDGAASEGDFHEALSFAAIQKLPVVFLCQNNGYAISVSSREQMPVPVAQRAAAFGLSPQVVDGTDPIEVFKIVTEAMERARAGNGPSLIEAKVERLTPHSSTDDDRRYRTDDEIQEAHERDPIKRFQSQLSSWLLLDDALDARILAEIKSEVEEAEVACERAAPPHPSTISHHVSCSALSGLQEVSPTELDGPDKTMLEAIREALFYEMERDEKVFIMGEDVGTGGVFRVTDGLRREFGNNRCFNTPVAESQIVGSAIGAAFAGLRPVAEIQFADFLYPAFNQIVNEAARVRYRSAGDFSCPIVIRAPYGTGAGGGLYHSQSPEAMFCHVPGLKIVSPSTPADAKGLLVSAIRDPDPVLFLEHKALYRLMKGPVPKGEYTVPIGRARVARPGSDVSVITYGLMVHHVLAAARQLASDGVDVEVLDIRTLRPLDTESVLETVRRTGKVLLVTEANPFCAVTSELGMLISEQAFDSLDAPLQRVTAPDCAGVPYASSLADAFVPSIAVIADAIRRLAAY